MGDISKDLEKEITLPAKLGRMRIGRKWQVLLVDDHGEMVTVRWFKPLAIGLIVLLIVSLGFSTVFLSFYAKGAAGTRALQDQVKQSEERIKSLRYELDILMARVVLAESGNGPQQAKKEKKADPAGSAKNKGSAAGKKEVGKSAVREAASREKPPKQVPAAPPPEKTPGVVVSDLLFTHEIPDNLLRVEFVVKNKKKNRGAVAGYVFVILKDDEANQKGWLTIPSVTLTEGKPDQIAKGQYFKISNYKTVYLRIRRQMKPERFNTAAILVYDPKGKVLLDDTRPVTIKTVEIEPPVKSDDPGIPDLNDIPGDDTPPVGEKKEVPPNKEGKAPAAETVPDPALSQDEADSVEPAVYY